MIDEFIITLLKEIGFPIFVAVLLLYDKIKSNGNLKKVVENNNLLLQKIEARM